MARKLLVLALLFAMMASGAAAQVTVEEVTVTPKEAWSDETVDITVRCQTSGNGTVLTDAYISVSAPINDHIDLSDALPVNATNATMSVSYDPPQLGVYDATATCEAEQDGETYDASASLGFTQKDLVVADMSFADTPLYTDSDLQLTFNVYEAYGDGQNAVTDAGRLDANLGLPSWTEHDLYHDGNTWVLTGDAALDPGTYRAQLTATVDDHTTSVSQTIDISRPFRTALETDDTGVSPEESLDILATPQYRETTLTLDDITIESVTVDGTSAEYTTTTDTLTVTMPDELDGDTTTITVDTRYVDGNGDTYTVTEAIELPTLYSVQGTLANVDGDPLNGRLTLKNSDVEKTTVFNDGTYDVQVPRGTYMATLRDLNGLREVTIEGIDIAASRADLFRIDNPETLNLEGVDVFGAAGIDTVAEFTDARVKVVYDPRAAKSEDDLQLYHCPVYNWDARYCYGAWDTVPSDLNTHRNYLAADVTELGGFAVGRRTPLRVNADIERAFRMDDTIQLRGAVNDHHGNPVPNATVSVELGEETFETETGDRGGFDLGIDTPAEEGTYTLRLTAEQAHYLPSDTEHSVDITADRSIHLKAPDELTVDTGTRTEHSITLRNTGQVPLYNLTVDMSVENCDTCITAVTPEQIAQLDEFEETSIAFTVNTSQDQVGTLLTGTVSIRNAHIDEETVVLIRPTDSTDTDADTGTDTTSSNDADDSTDGVSLTGYIPSSSLSVPTGMAGVDRMTLINVVSILIALTVLGYFKVADRRSQRTRQQMQGQHRLKQLREEAMDAVTIVDTIDDTGGTGNGTDTGTDADTDTGANTDADTNTDTDTDMYVCDTCDAAFDSQRGRSVHETKKH